MGHTAQGASRQIDHAAADAAYIALSAAKAAKFGAAQIAFDNRAEPEQDDDAPTFEDAHAQAVDELLTTAEPLTDWIAKKCDCDQGRAPIDTAKFDTVDLIDCDRVPVLLACIVNGSAAQERTAINRLRDLFLKAERKAVSERTAELLAGGL